jgi:PAS domain S-box-containing protein
MPGYSNMPQNNERNEMDYDPEDSRSSRELRRLRRELRRSRKREQPPIHNLFWGLMLILWAVLIFLLTQNYIVSEDLWKYFITGLGAIFLVQAIVYCFTPSYRSHILGRAIPGFILTFVGLNFVLTFNSWLPASLIAAGVAIIFVSWFLQREISKHQATREILRESEVKYRHIIDNANSVIMEIDINGNITFVNKYAEEFFGYSENEILNHGVVGTIVPAGTPTNDWDAMLKNIASTPEKYLHNERENICKNGDKVWVIWTFKPVMDEENKLKEILCIGIDKTQQKKAEDIAAQEMKEKTAQEERTRLARDLHDAVSQTLFSTSLIAEVLPRVWEKNKEEGLKKLEIVRQQTRGALAEMRTLLFELRPAALADADLSELLKQLSESVVGKSRISVEVQIDGTAEIPTDVKIAFYRIAQEALNNIVKHSGANRAQIELDCREDGSGMQITDNGCGFDTTQGAAGSFGLSNMKERAEQVSAVLNIDSEKDKGTRIAVDWHHSGEVKNDTGKTN